MAHRNPFEYGRELSLEELVDRQEELRELEATIRNRGKLFLIGPRRFGKTSLLSAAAERATRAGTLVLRLDAEKYESLELLAAAILTNAARALAGPLEKAIRLIQKVASRLEPRVTMEGESVSVRLGISPGSGDPLPVLTEALDAVERLAQESGRDVVVILDEVEQIVVEHGLAAERQLRSTVQQHRRVGYIFAGSATRLLAEMTNDPNRPFYRLGSRLFLGLVPRPEFEIFLSRGFADHDMVLTPEACSRILELAEEVPYNVQRLAHETWEMAQESRPDAAGTSVGPESVERALERIVRREDPAYTQAWTTLTSNRKKALKAVIQGGGTGLLAAHALRQSGLSASSLKLALTDLEKAHLVRREQAGGDSRYRLVDPFFAAWLRVFQS